MHIAHTRMQRLPELLKGAGAITDRQEFLDVIGVSRQASRAGESDRQFTAEQIRRACAAYGVNANWVLGLEQKIWSAA